MKTYLLVDGMNLFYRAAHATRGDPYTKGGLALHIILNAVRRAWELFTPNHVVFCLDKSSWRYDVYSRYKAQRKLKRLNATESEREADEHMAMLFDKLMAFLEQYTNVTVLQADRIEADDFIARWIQTHLEDQHIIVSGDSDFQQLLAANVKIFDGMKGHVISHNGVWTDRQKPVLGKDRKPLIPPDPKWALFKKCIRGDVSDNIMSAYPGVRETKIRAAFDDRETKAYDWNNFMQQRWVDHKGNEMLVADCYALNRTIIDLTAQPDAIKERMDETIQAAIQKPHKTHISIRLMRFCEQHQLVNISKNPNPYTRFLAESYSEA